LLYPLPSAQGRQVHRQVVYSKLHGNAKFTKVVQA
jgi:hypothetical protein